MNRVVLAACVAALTFIGCKKEANTTSGGTGAPGTGPASTGPGATGPGEPGTATPPADAKNPAGCNSDFAEPIVTDYALSEKCSPYTVKSDLNVDGYALTIEPGVELKFSDNTAFTVGYYKPGRVLVKGTKEKPVKFSGRTWKGLFTTTSAAGSSLENVEFAGAGTEDSPAFKSETHDVSLNGVTFTGAKKTVLDLRVDRPLKGLTAVDLTKASDDPTELIHANVATAGVFTPAAITTPEKAVIWLHQGLDGDVTLTHAGAVYRVTENLNIDPPEGKTASLTVKEGVTIELGENAALSFGYYRGPSGLKIQGTKEKPVTVTRYGEDKAQTPSGGIQLFAGARAPELDFLVIEYAGGTDKAAILLNESRGLGKITNCTFRHLKGEAVRVESAKDRFVAFDGNTFEDVEDAALHLPLELAHGLGVNNKFTDKARVVLVGETKKDTLLENVGAPYVVEGELNVNGDETRAATLTIAPGVSMLFNDQGKLSIAYYAPAKLVAKGTAQKPISFGKLLSGWGGIGLYNRAVIELENVTLAGTGDEVWPIDLTTEVTGTVKKLALKDTKKGVHACAAKVVPEGVTADKGVKATEKCE